MQLLHSYTGAQARRIPQEPPPYGAGWPEVVDGAAVMFVHKEEKPHEPEAHFYLLLAYDSAAAGVGRKRMGGWGNEPKKEIWLGPR